MNTEQPCTLLSFDEAVAYLRMPKSSVYKLTSRRHIPFLKPGKRILFCKEQLDTWLQGFYKKTRAELILESQLQTKNKPTQ